MTEKEHDSFEETLIADQEVSDAVAACEQEVIDSCAAEILPREESTAVREWVAASTRRTQRFRLAQSLLRAKQEQSLSIRRAMILAIAACLLVIAGLSSARFELARRKITESAVASTAGQSTSSPGRIASSPGEPIETATLVLVAERSRGAGPVPNYKIKQDVPLHLEILLNGTAASGSYDLKIESLDRPRKLVLERHDLKAQQSAGQTFVHVTFAAGSLPPATYQASVNSGENVMISRFMVAR
jgi:hypothetical protein